jgi:hypothetical protein
VLSCRNLLIYLQPVLQQKVFEFFNFSLKPQGLLLLGTSETPGDMLGLFRAGACEASKIYRSRGRKHPPMENRPLFSPMIDMGRSQPISRYVRSGHPASLRDEERLLERLLDTISEEFVTMIAVVNERMDLMHLSGNSTGILRLPTGKQNQRRHPHGRKGAGDPHRHRAAEDFRWPARPEIQQHQAAQLRRHAHGAHAHSKPVRPSWPGAAGGDPDWRNA